MVWMKNYNTDKNPEFMNWVPLNLVTSYLDMSPETLSRVRENLSG